MKDELERTILKGRKSYWPGLAVITLVAVSATWFATPSTARAAADVVPGMAIGSPGMEGPGADEYKVLAYSAAGKASIHATRQGHKTIRSPR